MLEGYRNHEAERAKQGIVPKPLTSEQTLALVELLKNPPQGEEALLLKLLEERIPPGVDEAAYVKAGFLSALAKGEAHSPLVSTQMATKLLGTMQGGYNVQPLIDLLDDEKLAPVAAQGLSHTLLMFDSFHDVANKVSSGNPYARQVMESWASAQWFLQKPPVPEKVTLTVFKVSGETNTDDLSPAQDAWSRPDIPLHALAMLKNARDGITPDKAGEIGPLTQLQTLMAQGYPLVYVGDVVGTGSSRKSAVNSLLWFMGQDIPSVPNKRAGGYCLGGKIAPIFFNTLEDAGALPIEVDVSKLNMGDVIDLYPYLGEIRAHDSGELLAKFSVKTKVLFDEVRAGGRIALIIGRSLTARACEFLGLAPTTVFCQPAKISDVGHGFTLAQKIVGKACGLPGVLPGSYCEPKMTTVGSQDTTGP
ncbi:MAG: bifunctional aconitate hydratase 2/2-methylisocitrate dehydratase, partial [Enterovibrio sp.]